MEKASTPRNRLTRSSAKQVNTPKIVDSEESAETSPGEEIKNSGRKTRRKVDNKAKTNGESSTVEDKIKNEDSVENNVDDKCEHDDVNLNNKSLESQKSTPNNITSPTISRKSLRTRRSSTPGPELESSASKKMTRSSSFGKLDLVSTPTNRRGRRAKSESKDFTFTPSKDKNIEPQDINSKHIPNSSKRIIDKIDEVNEVEKSSEDERETNDKEAKINNKLGERIKESCEGNNTLQQFDVRSDNECKDIGSTACPEKEVNANSDLLCESSSEILCNGVAVIETSETDSGLSIMPKDVESSEGTERCDHSKGENSGFSLELSVSPNKIETIASNLITPSESNTLSEVESVTKERLDSPSISEDICVNVINQNEVIKNQPNTDCEEPIKSPNTDCEKEKSAETKGCIEESCINDVDDTEVGNGNKMEITVTLAGSPPIQSDDGLSETNTGKRISGSKTDFKRQLEVDNRAESSDVPQIELINSSSDSEDGSTEKQPDISLMECGDDKVYIEGKNIASPTEEKRTCKTGSFNESIEKEENVPGVTLNKDSQMVDLDMGECQPHSESDEMIKDELKSKDDLESKTNDISETEIVCDQQVDIVEGDLSKKVEDVPQLYVIDSEPSNVETEHPITVDDSAAGNFTSHIKDFNSHDSLLQEHESENQRIALNESENQNYHKQTNNEPGLALNDEISQCDAISVKSKAEKNYDEERFSEEGFNDNYEEEEGIRSDGGSCDIYKGLSDSGSYVDEKTEDSQFGESVSSELHSGSGKSDEEYMTSVDDEEDNEEEAEEEEEKEEDAGPNKPCPGLEDLKDKDAAFTQHRETESGKIPDSPMTYDKALAIINKNRIKKIDDEEFFDMFTQELNRVSEQSGSDSDIAIVDEYLMEPEEPAKKNQPKSGIQTTKKPTRPSGDQSIPPENYPGDFGQSVHGQHGPAAMNQHGYQIPSQQSHPPMPRGNFSQGPLYQQYDQNLHLRNQLMYNQYGHPSSSMQDPHMFNPSLTHSDVNFNNGMFHPPHTLHPVSDSSFPPNSSSLKIKAVADINASQSSAHKSYSKHNQNPFDDRTFEHQEGNNTYFNMSSTVAEVHNTNAARSNILDSSVSNEFLTNKGDESKTPILNVLGLDKKSINLLKKALGLHSLELKVNRTKKCLRGIKGEAKNANSKRKREDSPSLKSSSEHSNEESSVASSDLSKGESFASSSENENREVSIEDGSVFVTLGKKALRYRNLRKKDTKIPKKSSRSVQEPLDVRKRNNKKKLKKKFRSSEVEQNTRKMPQKQPSVVKSQCGTFTVDPLTSQSSDSEVQSMDENVQLQEMKRKMKLELASGKNKLSNLFAQHSSKTTKGSKKARLEPLKEIKGPLRKGSLKELKKLPSEILETLANEDKSKKRQRSDESSSEFTIEVPKKKKRKNKKVKVKSKASEQNYIPCVTGGATEFGLSRLDKDAALGLAEKAAKFRTDQLYGASVKRITSKELINMKKKQAINDSLGKKKRTE